MPLFCDSIYTLCCIEFMYLCESFDMSFKHVPVGKWYPISFTIYRANISILCGVPPMQTNLKRKYIVTKLLHFEPDEIYLNVNMIIETQISCQNKNYM